MPSGAGVEAGASECCSKSSSRAVLSQWSPLRLWTSDYGQRCSKQFLPTYLATSSSRAKLRRTGKRGGGSKQLEASKVKQRPASARGTRCTAHTLPLFSALGSSGASPSHLSLQSMLLDTHTHFSGPAAPYFCWCMTSI